MIKPIITYFKWALLVATSIFLVSCTESNDPDAVTDDLGVYIINEGDFQKGTGSISAYNEEGSFNPDAFSTANGTSLLATAISMTIEGDYAVVAANSGDKIEICDKSTLTTKMEEVSLPVPRHSAIKGNTAFVTCWGPFGADWTLTNSKVFKIDLSTGTKLDSVACGSGPEGIILANDKVFVANSYTNTIEVFSEELELVNTITLSEFVFPKIFKKDNEGKIWASTTTGLVAIDPSSSSITKSVEIEGINFYGKMDIDKDAENIFVISGNPYSETDSRTFIQKYSIEDDEVSQYMESDIEIYGVGVNPSNGNIYVGSIVEFGQNGMMEVYDVKADSVLDTKIVGIGPASFNFY